MNLLSIYTFYVQLLSSQWEYTAGKGNIVICVKVSLKYDLSYKC